MSGDSMPRLLLVRCAAVSREEVGAAAQSAGLTVAVDSAANRREFADELRRSAPSVIVAGAESGPDSDLKDILDRAGKAEPAIPVVVVGGAVSESESLRMVRDGAAEYVQAADLDHLPSVLARTLRVRESSATQIRAQTERDRAIAVLRDNQRLITVGRLAASIAHEINNPLEAVTNLLYLLGEERELSASARGYIALAQRELARAGQIARQTLNFSRETAGPVAAHIDDLMEEVLSLYSRRIAEKDLRVEREYKLPEGEAVYPAEMRQIFSNLVTNAIEASHLRGRLRIRVRGARSWSDPGVRGIRVSIGDSGSGIEPAVQRRLGEPFFTTKGQRGTGLGLWVTRSIIERYGGEIQLRSSVAPERHGTVFSIFLPTNLRPTMVDRPPGPTSGGGSTGFSSHNPHMLAHTGSTHPRAHDPGARRDRSTEASFKRRASGG